jgi:pimeloyl-ACP methyl ester carboxylesterase
MSTANPLLGDPHATAQRISLAGGGALVVRGLSGAAPVVFLHGIGGGAWSWEPQAVALAQTRRTYAWEARGHGDTARVADAGLGDFYDDACQALTYVAHAEGRSAIVAGHSLGALFALALAASLPADVAGLFLVEPVYLSGSSTFLPLSGLPGFGAVWLSFLLALAEGFRYDVLPANLYARAIFARAFRDRAAMKRAWTHQQRQKPIEYRQAMLELTGASTRFPRRQFAREITCPVRLIETAGLGSGMHTWHLVEQLRRLGSDFTRREIVGGHYLQLDRESAVTADLNEFITTLKKGAHSTLRART